MKLDELEDTLLDQIEKLNDDYCFDGMNTEEAHREIKKNFDDFQTKIARGLVE